MSKYRTLGEDKPDEIRGARHEREVSNFLWQKGKLTIIRGFPQCPECSYVLQRQWKVDQWVCTHCHTVYTTRSLVEAIRNEPVIEKEVTDEQHEGSTGQS